MDTRILEQIGLSKNEIKVYFALLELEQSSATPIVKRSGIPNSKIYPTIEKLIKKGLASYVIKNNVRHFQASDPKYLIDILNNKQKQISLQKKEIEDLIPKIELKKKLAKEKQDAKVYEGLDGIKAAFNTILNTLNRGDEYLVFTLGEELKEATRFFQNYHKKRRQKGIKVRLITNTKLKSLILKSWYKYPGLTFRFTEQSLPTGIFIFKDHVMTLIWKDTPTAFIIHSKKNYYYYTKFFEEMWKSAKS